VAGSFTLYDYPGKFLTAADGNQNVKVRLQENQVFYEVAEASGNVRGMGSGNLFSLIDFPRDDQNKEYLIVSATYHLQAAILETSSSGQTGDEFRASYRLIDSQTQFRPALTSHKPRVEGPQTATYRDRASNEPRVGYWDPDSGLFHRNQSDPERPRHPDALPGDLGQPQGPPGIHLHMKRSKKPSPPSRAELRLHAELVSEAHRLAATDPSPADVLLFAETFGRDSIVRSTERVARYIERLSSSGGDLEYEEMHKLFSLIDDLYALGAVTADDEAVPKAIRERIEERLSRQPRVARLVAQDRGTLLARLRWPYDVLLNAKSRRR
jgi:hypothetical protein